MVKVVMWSRGGGLTWRSQVGANPIPIPHPTNLALFAHKITLYRFNQGGLILLPGAQIGAGGLSPLPPHLPLYVTGHTTSTTLRRSKAPINWDDCDRKGIWHKTGGGSEFMSKAMSLLVWQPKWDGTSNTIHGSVGPTKSETRKIINRKAKQ